MPESLRLDDLVTLCGQLIPGSEPDADANFFALGGDSYTAVTLCAAVEERWGVQLDPVALLAAGSLRDLYEAWTRADA